MGVYNCINASTRIQARCPHTYELSLDISKSRKMEPKDMEMK